MPTDYKGNQYVNQTEADRANADWNQQNYGNYKNDSPSSPSSSSSSSSYSYDTPSSPGTTLTNSGGMSAAEKLARSLFSRGDSLMQQGNYYGAIEAYTKAIEAWKDRDMGGAYHQRGVAYMELEDYQKAIEDFTSALSYPEYFNVFNHIGPYMNRGYCHLETGQYEKCIADYTKAFELGAERNPKYKNNLAAAYNNLGNAYKNTGKKEQARAAYEKAISLGSSDARKNLAKLDNPGEPELNQGLAAYNAKDYAKAVELWRKAADMGNAVAIRNLGECYRCGFGVAVDNNKAKEFLKKAASMGDEEAKKRLAKQGW